jgi:ribonucleoside-diphosphate reductase beta chain
MDSEPLLNQSNQRMVIFPIQHHNFWEMYKKMRSAFWTPEEIDFSNDLSDWNKLNDDEQYFIENILAFFAGSDGIVNMNISLNFSKEVTIPEAKFVYDFQSMIEGIHAETYSLMIDNYIMDPVKKNELFAGIETIPCVSKKAEWAMKWIKNKEDEPFAKRLIAFAIVEGIFFSGSFCAIYWLKQRGLMPGLTFSNELISRDEGMHTDFACMLYSKIINKIDQSIVHQMFNDALEIEKEFINKSLPCRLIGMNSELMSRYLEFVADRLLVQLGYDKIYKSSNPFPFMDAINLQGKTNFFEHRVSQYQKAKLDTNQNISVVKSSLSSNTLNLSEDF